MAEIDLQDPLEGEYERAYLSYLIYRDLGVNRSMLAAYTIYLKETGKWGDDPSRKILSFSKSFRDWGIKFRWEERASDWDRNARKRVQDALLAADRKKYLDQLEKNRSQLERTAANGMNGAELAQTVLRGQLQVLAKESTNKDKDDNVVPIALSKTRLEDLCRTTRALKDAIDGLSAAKHEYYDAVGLIDTLKELETDD